MVTVAVSYSKKIGGSSVLSLKASFKKAGAEVVDADYTDMIDDIPKEVFDSLYKTEDGRRTLFAHAKAKAKEILKDVDVLALSGNSAMIDPELFGEQRDSSKTYNFSRTIAELALAHVAIEAGMPILGVCGGHQLLAVYEGGEIIDLESAKLSTQGYMDYETITLNINSMLAQIITRGKVQCTQYQTDFFGAHTQIISKLGRSFVKTATASDGESIEAIESKGVGAPIIGVQFHPEVGAVGLPESKTLYTRSSEDKEKNLSIIRFFVKAGEQYHAAKILRTELMQFKVLAQINAHGIDITPTIKPSDILKAQGNQKTNTNQPNAKVKKSHNILVSFLHAIYKLLKFISIKIGAIFGEVIRSISSRGLVAIQQQKPPTSPVAKLSVSPPYRILSETPAKLWTDTAPHTAEMKPDSVVHTLSSPSPQ